MSEQPDGRTNQDAPGCRLEDFYEAWAQLTSSPEILSLIRHGYEIPFHNMPEPPLTKPRNLTILPKEQMKVVRSEVKKLLKKKVVRVVSVQEADRVLGFYLQLFCVTKPDGGWRTIINLKPLNKFIVGQKFSMETTEDVRHALSQGAYGATIDLKDAF